MITCDHILYLKNELESEDGYSHPELYEWSEIYLKAKDKPFFFKGSYVYYENRYSSLKQSTRFFKNLHTIDDLVYASASSEEFEILVDLNRIQREAAHFAICYNWMSPGRCFSFDWRKEKEIPFPSEREMISWNIVDSVYQEISKKNLPILEASYFINTDICNEG